MKDKERYEGIKGFHIYNPSKVLLYTEELKSEIPVFLELHPSTICNHKCIWCRYKGMSEGHSLTKQQLFDLFYEYPEVKGIRISGGGEPLVNKHLLDFLQHCKESYIKTSLETNGALLTDESIKVISECCQYCRISLDAFTPETYKIIHGSDDFSKVIDNIRKLSETKIPELGISYLVTRYNVWEIPRLLNLNLKVSYVHFKPLIEGIDREIKEISLEKIKRLKPKVKFMVKYDRILQDYYFNKNVGCEISKIIRVIGGDGKEYVCCEHAYEPDFEVGKWNGSTKKCVQCRYNNYNEILDMWKKNIFTKEFL